MLGTKGGRKSAPSYRHPSYATSLESSHSASSPEVDESTGASAGVKRKHGSASSSSDEEPPGYNKQAARKSAPGGYARKSVRSPSPSISDSEGERQLLERYFEIQASASDNNTKESSTLPAAVRDVPPAQVIQDLQGQIRELHDFIDRAGIALGMWMSCIRIVAPPSL